MPVLAAIPFPEIDPILISFGPLAIRWYALAYVAGLLGGWYYCRRLVENASLWGSIRRPSAEDIDDLIVWMALGIVCGGRIGYVLFYNLDYFLANPAEIPAVWRGGMSFHGGMAGAILAMVWFARRRGLGPLSVIDLVATVVPLGLLFGRLANFINGELWGRPAPDLPFAVIFPHAGPIPRHPSQIYEALTEGLLLLLILGWLARRGGLRRPGLVGGAFLLGYALFRIGCEFFREPDPQLGFLFGTTGVTMGMVLSVPMALVGLGVILHALRRPPAGETPAPIAPAKG